MAVQTSVVFIIEFRGVLIPGVLILGVLSSITNPACLNFRGFIPGVPMLQVLIADVLIPVIVYIIIYNINNIYISINLHIVDICDVEGKRRTL